MNGKNRHIGSSVEAFLEDEHLLEDAQEVAVKRVLAWQVQKAMVRKGFSKTELAKAMQTSRASIDRMLSPDNTSITLRTINRAANALGMEVRIELTDPLHEETDADTAPSGDRADDPEADPSERNGALGRQRAGAQARAKPRGRGATSARQRAASG